MNKFKLTDEQIENIKKQARSECARNAILTRHAKMSPEEKILLGQRLNAAVKTNKESKKANQAQ